MIGISTCSFPPTLVLLSCSGILMVARDYFVIMYIVFLPVAGLTFLGVF